MVKSKLITLNLSPKSNKKELFYREETQQTEQMYDTYEKWKNKIGDGRITYFKRIAKKIRFHGRILELGAGSTWFGSSLSKLPEVKEVYSLDFSKRILTKISPKIMDIIKADKRKITRVIGDFYNLDFPKNHFDMIVIDAALHHIDDIDIVLNEIKKVLKDEGLIVAIREPVIPKLRPGCKKTFGAHEISLGLTENIFSKKEWKTFFHRNGFKLYFLPIIPEYSLKHKLINRTILRKLNGLLFAHYVFIAKKTSI